MDLILLSKIQTPIILLKYKPVRVADRLSYISANTFGAFSSITTRGLLYIQYGGFITILVNSRIR